MARPPDDLTLLIPPDLPRGALVLHIGPGARRGLPPYPATAARLVLVEADPTAAARLAPMIADRPGARLIAAALVPGLQGDSARLRRWSLATCDSTEAPGPALAALFPGLTARPPLTVPALDLPALLDLLPPAAPDNPDGTGDRSGDMLLIGAPGLAWPVLQALDQTGALARFARVGLITTDPPTHGREAGAAALAGWLAARGFDRPRLTACTDPGLTCLTADRAVPAPVYDPAAQAAWARLGARAPLPRLIEVKSLPRSGLHFLQAGLAAGWGGGFSFCEWYLEPGCCRRMPCALTCLADPDAPGAGPGPHLRLTKSHDFALTDPVWAPGPGMLRLVLLRDPLAVLTSWLVMDLADQHRGLLAAAHLHPQMMQFRHQPALVQAVLGRIAADFTPPPPERLDGFLTWASGYITGFVRKWTAAADPARQRVLTYDQVAPFVAGLLGDLAATLPAGAARTRVRALQAAEAARFTPRRDPFALPGAPAVAAWLAAQAPALTAAAARIRAALPDVDFGPAPTPTATAPSAPSAPP